MTTETCKKISREDLVPEIDNQLATADMINTERRKVLQKLAVGSAAIAGCTVLPERWTIPVLEFAALPAHATTSGDIVDKFQEAVDAATGMGEAEEVNTENVTTTDTTGETAAAEPAAETTTQDVAAADTATGGDELRGYSNSLTIENTGDQMSCDSIWQDRFVFSKLGPEYASSFLIVWSDGNELYVPDSTNMTMNVDQNDFRKYQPGGPYSGNNPDIPTMEVYAKRGTHPSSVTLYY